MMPVGQVVGSGASAPPALQAPCLLILIVFNRPTEGPDTWRGPGGDSQTSPRPSRPCPLSRISSRLPLDALWHAPVSSTVWEQYVEGETVFFIQDDDSGEASAAQGAFCPTRTFTSSFTPTLTCPFGAIRQSRKREALFGGELEGQRAGALQSPHHSWTSWANSSVTKLQRPRPRPPALSCSEHHHRLLRVVSPEVSLRLLSSTCIPFTLWPVAQFPQHPWLLVLFPASI